MQQTHRHPRITLAILSILVVLSGIAATGLRIDSDSSKMLSPDLPAQRAAQALNEAFPSLKGSILVTVTAPRADTADLAVIAIARDLRERPAIERVFAPAEDPYLAANGFLYRDTEDLEQVFTRLSKSANLLAHLRADQSLDGFAKALDEAIVLAERAEIGTDALERLFAETASVLEAQTLGRPRAFAWNTVLEDEISGDTTRLINVTPRLDTSRLSPARAALDDIDAAIANLPQPLADAVAIGVTGEPALRAEELRSVATTIGLSLALSLVLVAALLYAGLRRAGSVVLALGALVVSLILTTGIAAVAVGSLNLISIAFIVLMVGLGIDFAIHVLSHIAEMRRDGTDVGEAITLTGHRTGQALSLSAMTTALAFLAFTITDFVGMAQLGIIGAAGVLVAFAVSCTLIPAVLALAPALSAGPRTRRRWKIAARFRRVGAPVLALAGLLAIWPATQARFDADPMGLRDPAAPSVMAFRMLAEDAETTPYRASIVAASAAEADRIAARFDDVEGIGAAINLGDLVPEDQDVKLTLLDLAAPSIDHAVAGQPTALLRDGTAEGDRLAMLSARLGTIDGMAMRLKRAIGAYQAMRTTASDEELTARIFQTFRLLTDRLEAMINADTVTASTLPEALRERFLSAERLYRVEVIPEVDLSDPAAARDFAETVLTISPEATGAPIQLAAAGRTVAQAMLMATLLAAAMTALLAFAGTGRPGDAVAILLPLGVAGLMTAAFSALADIPFNYANVIVLPLMIGIGVDSGIHIALREHRAPGAVFATSTPGAVILAALTTVVAFGTLALSDHRGTASMGILLSVAILATIVSVLVLTPSLIRMFRSRYG